jgi:cytochrome c oxidase cbb3-type subunit 3
MNPEIKRGHYAREKGEVVLREHEFDGIQEFDQKLPNWWLFTFYGAVVFFVIYWCVYYYTGALRTDQQAIIEKVTALQQKKDAELAATLASLDDKTLIGKWAVDPMIVASGEATFMTNCSACHASDLSGTMKVSGNAVPLPGLPLNDHQWKYGGNPMDIFKLVNQGTPPESSGHNGAKMVAWGQVLSPKQIAEVTAFLIAKNPEDFSKDTATQ